MHAYNHKINKNIFKKHEGRHTLEMDDQKISPLDQVHENFLLEILFRFIKRKIIVEILRGSIGMISLV